LSDRSEDRGPTGDAGYPPVLLVTGAKDSGKTTLMVELIRGLRARGFAVLALKRASHAARGDDPGTDTARFAEAGARATGLTWPGGSYVAVHATGAQRNQPVRALRFRGPSGVGDLVSAITRLMSSLRGGSSTSEEPLWGAGALPTPGDALMVLGEGFSDTPYPRVHVTAGPGRRSRPAQGPLLAVWPGRGHARPEAGTWMEAAGGGTAVLAGGPDAFETLLCHIDSTLPLLATWAEEVARHPDRPRPGTRNVVGAVLAGGKGRRLGERDKWELVVGGKPQSLRVLSALGEVFGDVLVVGREPPRGGSGSPVDSRDEAAAGGAARVSYVSDARPGSGPLGGVLSTLIAARAARGPAAGAMVVAGDMPFLSPALIRHILFTAERRRGSFDVLLPRWDGYVEPLHAFYGPACLEHLRDLPSLAGRRITEVLSGLKVAEIPQVEVELFGRPEVVFCNLNTSEDLAWAEEIARTGGGGAAG